MIETDNTLLDGYYTMQQAAEYLDCSIHSLKKYVYRSRKLVPDINLRGRQLLFTRATLDAFNANWRRPAHHDNTTNPTGGAQ